ncbi:hypothetical protein C6499_05290 [Candidatus Poribacteria bacterium]|nr:MAG: hypothetical protein C6499_05290 [Candidatus Poribacteria bacterium]
MQRIEITTKPNGAGRNWLEVGHFETDTLDRKQWVKKNVPHQDSKLTVDRQYSARGETIDWIVIIPDNYPFTLVKVTYDRLNPKELEVLWSPDETPESESETPREDKIKRAFELAADNEELTNLLKELLST